MIKNKFRSAFTIVELIVVISVIAILAGIVLVSYGAWHISTATNSLKSDLEHVASAMESAHTFNNTFPLTLPTTFSASANNTITLTLPSASSFCIDGTTSISNSIQYYIDDVTQKNGATQGTCATRTIAAVPTAPASVAIVSATGTQVSLSWPVVTGAISYTAQCATDPTFIYGLVQTSSTTTAGSTVSATVTGLDSLTTFYCRVNAVSSAGTSAWTTATSSSTTTNTYGSLAVGTSIEGYWSAPPKGFLTEDGSAVSRTTYSDLFAVIGTTYGAGDNSTTFNLPNSQGRTVVNKLASDPYFGTIGQISGSKTVTLTLPQIPLHTHVQLVGPVDDKNFTGYQIAGQYPPADGPGVYNSGITTGATGGNGAHNNIQPSITRMFVIKYAPVDSSISDLSAGSSIHGYWSTAPTGYLLEDGSAKSRTTYATLFAAIGTTYGTGDGSTTFNLPDSRGRADVNLLTGDAQFGYLNQKYGEENHLLTINELPSHSHPIAVGQIDDQNFTGYTTGSNQYPPADAVGSYNTGDVTGNTGSGGSSTFSDIQPSITELSAIKYTAASGTSTIASGTSLSGYWSTAPTGYLIENGAAVSRTTYASLFSVISTTYGVGDGSTTFNLPDSRGILGVGLSSTDSEFNTIGETYGEKTHTLTIAEMPSHTHTLTLGQIDDKNFTGYASPGQYAPADGPGAYYTGITTTSTGGGQAFNLIQPSIVKLFVIKY